MPASLNNNQKRYLRSLAHDLKPIVMVGAKGITENLVAELDLALAHHELVKVKVAAEDRDSRDKAIAELFGRVDASVAQRIGNIAVAWRRNSSKPQIELPR